MYNKAEQMEILAMRTEGYWSALGGVEVKKIEHGIEDYVVCVSSSWKGKRRCHHLRIKYTEKGRAFVIIEDIKLYLDECIRN